MIIYICFNKTIKPLIKKNFNVIFLTFIVIYIRLKKNKNTTYKKKI